MSFAVTSKKLQERPWHFLLLILFFLLHGYRDSDGLAPVRDLLFYGAMVAAIAWILYVAASRFYRDSSKAGLLVTLLLFVYLFYGVVQDRLQASGMLMKLARDHVLIPLLAVMLLIVAVGLKWIRSLPAKLTLYLNLLLLLYVVADMVLLGVGGAEREKQVGMERRSVKKACDTCSKPDIYLLLLDEYAGSRTLMKEFGYSNQGFVDRLRSKGFFVADTPSSNYAYTPFSMACMFNMDYSGWQGMEKDINAKHYTMAANQIGRSPALQELQQQGYELQNLSIFDILNKPAAFDQGFMALKLRLVTDKTMWERFRKSLFWQFDRQDGWGRKLGWDGAGRIGKGNTEMIRRTMELAGDSTKKAPQFVYTHLLMPHPPYLYDSLGRPGDAGYLSYLKYATREVERLVDTIMKGEQGQAVIIVMSDHGMRKPGVGWASEEFNNNFNAVYLPRRNYDYFYASISNVNQFRMLFNSLFDSGYEVLKDSVVF